ncbi:MAG: M4 family metallopeptidase [Actinomycetia bacterium]|nr:M4 family metallopeptidase [Actinomycetes bacterium]
MFAAEWYISTPGHCSARRNPTWIYPGGNVESCGRRRTSIDPKRGLCAGAVMIGIGMSLAVGPGVATATPSDSSDASQTAETSNVDGPSAAAASNDGSDTSLSDAPDTDSGTDPGEAADLEEAAEPAEAAEEAADLEEAAEAEDAVDLEQAAAGAVTEEAGDLEEAAETEVTEAADGTTAAEGSPSADGGGAQSADEGEEPATSGRYREAVRSESAPPLMLDDEPRSTVLRAVNAETPSVAAAEVTSTVTGPMRETTDLAVTAVRSAPTMRSLVSARPVTVDTIVADLLTWAGLRPPAGGLPVPAAPVSALVQSLWLAVRQVQYTLNNQRPTAEATISEPGPDGVVSGSLNAVDYDDSVLTYRVTEAPTFGSVVIDALGNFAYTPDLGTPNQGDRFTVTIDDTAGNPFHIHGLLGLLGITGPTEVAVVIAPTPVRRAAPAAIDLTDLLSRDGVGVAADSRGAVSVIDGRFTDELVTTAADAAAVMNALAPALGATAGFADPAVITTARAGVGSSVESFYRLSETVGGIKVLGSEMILVTDADGGVTGLFNNYRGLAPEFDVTPAATVDEDAEVYLIAGNAYLGSGADAQALEAFLAQNTFTNQLIVYALDDEAAPSLAWRLVVEFPDMGDMSQPGATYLIDADGTDAGTIISIVSTAREASAVAVAQDWLGDERTITIDSSQFFFFTSHKLVDATRNITTYNTSFPFFGLFGPSLPGSVVQRGWFGWDPGAVSAHANHAVAYDYFQDVLGRTSFDGAGAPIVVSIRYNPFIPIFGGYSNAFWDESKQLFGYGDKGYLQAALDVVGHEFTHAVVSYVVGDGGAVLDYGESGALNEAYADLLGLLIEGKSGHGRWLIAEDSSHGILRNLANPAATSTPQGVHPTHYDDRYTGSGDYGGVHINSTIFSHAAYKMMTAPATSGIPDETWASLFYQSLYRLSPGAVFTDGRAAVLSTAAALEFTEVQLDAIRSAFDSVGIPGAAAPSAVAA